MLEDHNKFIGCMKPDDTLFFSRNLSTGCGPDAKRCYLGKFLVDGWFYWECIKHDMYYFCGFRNDGERENADLIFYQDMIKKRPDLELIAKGIYELVRVYDGWEHMEQPRGYSEFLWIKDTYFPHLLNETKQVPGIELLMDGLRNRERNGQFLVI